MQSPLFATIHLSQYGSTHSSIVLQFITAQHQSRYRMPSRAEIAKMGGDDDREDKERVMAGFLSGSVNVR